ncbi:RNA helicase [Caenorhabditis elegans]|uniref:RNA helicase n=1 Tax=Caenorhabditis elegans TaxID=6239 RepID=Q17978_CAEEL|nr:MUTator [Caenorhabditis elegans]CCD64500.1 MUTator [Caenorhabditis elegans]|eukprot:NP_504490.1 MUTator [Caenorhabditis elegans]
MSYPWSNKNGEAASSSKTTVAPPLSPPRYEKVLDFSTLDTQRHRYEVRDQANQRAVVSSAKAESSMIDKFCKENTRIQTNPGIDLPDDYGTDAIVANAIGDQRIVNNLKCVHVTTFNAVQQMSIQVIREGRGLVVEAPTGIGKTYAFLIPAIEAALKNRQSNCFEYTKPSPSILIMASTSALVDQLFNRCELILGLQCMDNVEPIRDIKIDKLVANHPFTKGQCDIAFCTIGKLKATIECGDVCLDNLKTIILDEADKMIDNCAFGPDINWILDQLKEENLENLQSCFFSATYNKNANGTIALTVLQMRMLGEDDPWSVIICPRMSGYITQRVVRVGRGRPNDIRSHPWVIKMGIIRKLIDDDLKETGCSKDGPYNETIAIFCETVQRVTQVTMALRQLGYNFKPVCSMITKNQQLVTVNDLEFRKIHGVVCTNILARGIDVSSVKHTIIMEMSADFDTYKHRIGRVGRDGCGGKSTVLVEHHQLQGGPASNVIEQLYNFMKESKEDIPQWMQEWIVARRNNNIDSWA